VSVIDAGDDDLLLVPPPERPPFDPTDPRWWLAALLERLHVRSVVYRKRIDYYRGRHELLFLTEKYRQAFGRWLRRISDNWCAVVVDAAVERMAVEGFRFGTDEADREAWRIWQSNALDASSDDLHTLLLACGDAATVVEAPLEGTNTPRITVENPLEVAVYGTTRERIAAIKRTRGLDGYVYVTVWLPDLICHYRSTQAGSTAGHEFDEDTDAGGIDDNPLGVVPVVPFRNVGAALVDQVTDPSPSDLDGIIPMQDTINKLVADLMIDSEFAAFKQKVFIGVEAPTDSEGRPLTTTESAANRVITLTNADAKIAEFSAADPSGLIRAIEMRNQQLCAIARIPPYYLLGQSGTFPSGESLKAAETGIVRKVTRRNRVASESWEETIRLAFAYLGDERAGVDDAETIWANPETRSDASVADAAVKKATVGVPFAQNAEDMGYSPQQIERMQRTQQEELASAGPTEPTVGNPAGNPAAGNPAAGNPAG
jgi:Phage portal protein, SPP1 Gp6-like